MIAPFAETGWQFEELRKFLKKHDASPDLNHLSIYLVNPEDRLALDRAILGVICPRIEAAFAGSPMSLLPTRESRLRDSSHRMTDGAARELGFCVVDAKRPIGSPHQTPWFLRGTVACSLTNYMLMTDLYLSFPTTFSLRRVISLLKNEQFRGCPPKMTYDTSHSLPDSYGLHFHGGTGESASTINWESAAQEIENKLKEHVGIVEAVYALERDYSDSKAFRGLVKQLEQVYEAT